MQFDMWARALFFLLLLLLLWLTGQEEGDSNLPPGIDPWWKGWEQDALPTGHPYFPMGEGFIRVAYAKDIWDASMQLLNCNQMKMIGTKSSGTSGDCNHSSWDLYIQ